MIIDFFTYFLIFYIYEVNDYHLCFVRISIDPLLVKHICKNIEDILVFTAKCKCIRDIWMFTTFILLSSSNKTCSIADKIMKLTELDPVSRQY